MELASLVADSPGAAGRRLTLTGHSKGGGMATAAALSAGVPAVTFNTAGVHKNTVPGAKMSKTSQLVTDYVVDGDLLNHGIQDNRRLIQGAVVGASAAAGNTLGGPLGAALASGYAANRLKDTLPQSLGRRVDLPFALRRPGLESKTFRGLMNWANDNAIQSSKRFVHLAHHSMDAVRDGLEARIKDVTECQIRNRCLSPESLVIP